MTPRTLFRAVSITEAITWTLLIIGMILKYSGVTELGVRIGGGLHGFGFLCFVLVSIFVGLNQRWSRGVAVLTVLSSVVPWLTLLTDRMLERRQLLDGEWRREDQGLRGWVLAHPVLAALAALVVVSGVFSFLLWLGPPTGWATRFA